MIHGPYHNPPSLYSDPFVFVLQFQVTQSVYHEYISRIIYSTHPRFPSLQDQSPSSNTFPGHLPPLYDEVPNRSSGCLDLTSSLPFPAETSTYPSIHCLIHPGRCVWCGLVPDQRQDFQEYLLVFLLTNKKGGRNPLLFSLLYSAYTVGFLQFKLYCPLFYSGVSKISSLVHYSSKCGLVRETVIIYVIKSVSI